MNDRVDDALVAEPGPTTLPPLRRPAALAASSVAPAARRVMPADGPLLTIDPVPLPDPVPAGSLPPPPPSPFTVLPAPVWCVLPAVGWQQRATRPIVTPLPEPAPAAAPRAGVDLGEVAPRVERVVDVVEAPADEVAHLFPGGWPDAWAEPDRVGPTDRPDGAAPATEVADAVVEDLADPAGRPAGHEDDLEDGDKDGQDAGHELGHAPVDRLVHHLRQAGRWASFAVLGAAVWVLLLTTVPRAFGWQPTVITGHSMEPSIARGDVVVVRPAPPAAYVPGAVITFSDINRPGHLITHRVIKVNDDGTLVTRGDNNHDNDPQATPVSSVKGRAVLRVPFAGKPVVWVMDRSWLPLAGTVAVLLLVIRTLLHPGGPRRRPRPWPLFSAPTRRT